MNRRLSEVFVALLLALFFFPSLGFAFYNDNIYDAPGLSS